MNVAEVMDMLEQIAPLALSESWDNTGLLLGDRQAPISRIMTCLTITSDVVTEAIDEKADMVISHHPLPFKPLARLTTDSIDGGLVWRLAQASIHVYSPHTAWDSATDGINVQLARKLSLIDIEPLIASEQRELGAGRYGLLKRPQDLASIVRKLTASVPHCRPRAVYGPSKIERVGLACGSGGSFVKAAADKKCHLLITGEATFHTCLEAQARGVGLLMIGHFASEKFAMDELANRLANALDGVHVWGSTCDHDPVRSIDLDGLDT